MFPAILPTALPSSEDTPFAVSSQLNAPDADTIMSTMTVLVRAPPRMPPIFVLSTSLYQKRATR